jgi:hypothetical protein
MNVSHKTHAMNSIAHFPIMNPNHVFSASLCSCRLSLLILGFLSPLAVAPTSAVTTFSSPEKAVSALSTAVSHRDTNALYAIFGPELRDIRSADPVQAQNELTDFITRFNATNHIAHVQADRCTLEIGTDQWPFAIPLVRTNGSWFFDTAAGKHELTLRRIGDNELQALKSIRAGADAQREYASADRDGSGVMKYAQKIVSTSGTKDGLYWPKDLDGTMSPLGPAIAEAQTQGYLQQPAGQSGPQPFHGYFFKILTQQGPHATGGKYDYIINGNMIAGFALVAWPAKYRDTGIMTFIINQQGKVYQKDLGPDTESLAAKMTAYDPDPNWIISPD